MLREVAFPPKVTQHRRIDSLSPTGAERGLTHYLSTLCPQVTLCSVPVLQVAEAPPEVLDTRVCGYPVSSQTVYGWLWLLAQNWEARVGVAHEFLQQEG